MKMTNKGGQLSKYYESCVYMLLETYEQQKRLPFDWKPFDLY